MDKTTITLRIQGPALEPNDVTSLTGLNPSKAYRAGDPLGARPSLAARKHKVGFWSLQLDDGTADTFSEQLRELLRRVPSDIAQKVNAEADVFVGAFGVRDQSSLQIDPDVLAGLGDRNWTLVFDLYVKSDDEEST